MRILYILVMYIEMEIEAIYMSCETFAKGVILEEQGKECRIQYCNAVKKNNNKKHVGGRREMRERPRETESDIARHQ